MTIYCEACAEQFTMLAVQTPAHLRFRVEAFRSQHAYLVGRGHKRVTVELAPDEVDALCAFARELEERAGS